MTKIEVADDAGDTFTEISIPIPFYIRVHLEERKTQLTRYRVRLLDDFGKVRGQYIGATDREYLELHVPLIKLAKPGSLRIFVEESSGIGEYDQSHYISIKYLEYTEEQPSKRIADGQIIPITEEKNQVLLKEVSLKKKKRKKSFDLSNDETEYLFKREAILGENPIKSNEEE
ncbi:MAG: hypothetical protein EAX86_04790 [Candidatus Heimdallarchaeota archaeon]|nr:hypothetical protein [Candidatus Heimdallarchaeota archaeon]